VPAAPGSGGADLVQHVPEASTVGLSSAVTVMLMMSEAATTPMMSPSCWTSASRRREAGLEVLRRRPGVAAATQTMPPTQSAIGW
jgi:hypothetical protein